MMDLKELFKKANAQADKFVSNVKSADLGKQSTCTDWSVKDLLNHMVNENLWMPELLAGKTVAEVGDEFDGDVLGEDFIKAWEDSAKATLEAVEDLTDLNQITHLSFADVPASEYLNQLVLDKTIHGWDIAKSTDQPDTLEQELVDYIYQDVAPREEELRGYGVFGPKVEVPEDADKQTKLLAILGRKR
jgi:uncharacterized protein (TIGR03086 family)